MRRIVASAVCFFMLSNASGFGQKRISASQPIKRVDFLTFTYPLGACADLFRKDGMPATVSVKEGRYSSKDVVVYVEQTSILYADLTHEGKDQAIVPLHCGLAGANYDLLELLVYEVHDGQPQLRARLDHDDFRRAYSQHYPVSTLWSAVHKLRASDSGISIDMFADGPHCCPKYAVTLAYVWNGRRLLLCGKPIRKLVPELGSAASVVPWPLRPPPPPPPPKGASVTSDTPGIQKSEGTTRVNDPSIPTGSSSSGQTRGRSISKDSFDDFYRHFRAAVRSHNRSALRELMSVRFEWALDGVVGRNNALNNIAGIIGWQKFWLSAGNAVVGAAVPCKPPDCNYRPGYHASAQTPFPIELLFERGTEGRWRWTGLLGD